MKNDILHNYSEELRKTPFKVPEGYFAQVKGDMIRSASAVEKVSPWKKISPYVSVAAAFIFLITAGTFILEKSSSADDMTYEDYLVHSDILISAGYEQDSQIADASIVDEDIIEYLIYTGISAEALELSK